MNSLSNLEIKMHKASKITAPTFFAAFTVRSDINSFAQIFIARSPLFGFIIKLWSSTATLETAQLQQCRQGSCENRILWNNSQDSVAIIYVWVIYPISNSCACFKFYFIVSILIHYMCNSFFQSREHSRQTFRMLQTIFFAKTWLYWW